MRRCAAPVLLAMLWTAGAVAAADNAPAPDAASPLGQTVARCKTAPSFCAGLIAAARQRVTADKLACIPKDVTPDQIAARIMHTAEEVLEEDPDFADFSYGELAGQLIVFTWPCGVVS